MFPACAGRHRNANRGAGIMPPSGFPAASVPSTRSPNRPAAFLEARLVTSVNRQRALSDVPYEVSAGRAEHGRTLASGLQDGRGKRRAHGTWPPVRRRSCLGEHGCERMTEGLQRMASWQMAGFRPVFYADLPSILCGFTRIYSCLLVFFPHYVIDSIGFKAIGTCFLECGTAAQAPHRASAMRNNLSSQLVGAPAFVPALTFARAINGLSHALVCPTPQPAPLAVSP